MTDVDTVLVSIPFIAGQWSLQDYVLRVGQRDGGCFNPLHCGAVVASIGQALTASRAAVRFNPLHCGAVVASRARKSARSAR